MSGHGPGAVKGQSSLYSLLVSHFGKIYSCDCSGPVLFELRPEPFPL
jgi:hypothetical protein